MVSSFCFRCGTKQKFSVKIHYGMTSSFHIIQTLGYGIPVFVFSKAGSNLVPRSLARVKSSLSYPGILMLPNGCSGSVMIRWADNKAPNILEKQKKQKNIITFFSCISCNLNKYTCTVLN